MPEIESGKSNGSKGSAWSLEQAEAMLAEGKGYREIGEAMGLSKSHVHTKMSKAAKAAGKEPLTNKRVRAKPLNLSKAQAMKAAGKTYQEIADALGVAKSTVFTRLQQASIASGKTTPTAKRSARDGKAPVQAKSTKAKAKGSKKCRDCSKRKPLKAFSTQVRSPDGHMHICVGCYSAKRKAAKAQRSTKICKSCDQSKALTSYPKSLKSKDGHMHLCSPCLSLKQKAAQQKRAADNRAKAGLEAKGTPGRSKAKASSKAKYSYKQIPCPKCKSKRALSRYIEGQAECLVCTPKGQAPAKREYTKRGNGVTQRRAAGLEEAQQALALSNAGGPDTDEETLWLLKGAALLEGMSLAELVQAMLGAYRGQR
jgi:DNA-binding CsgD family transcriptional regulator